MNEDHEFLDYGELTLGELPAKVLKYRTQGLNGDETVIEFWYEIGGGVYRVSCSYTSSTEALYNPLFEAIMSSYTVEDGPVEVYAQKVQELAMENSDLLFSLIDLTGNDAPELVADASGYYVSVFAYVDGEVIPVMDQWPYGAGGANGYEYAPGENVIADVREEL